MCVALFGILASSCNRSPANRSGSEKEITLAVTPWPASAAIYVAKEKGYFRNEGLKLSLEEYPSGHLGLAAMLQGKADLASCGDTPIVHSALDRKPVKIVATICRIDQAILIIARRDRGIREPADLRGKRVGVVRNTTADFFFHVFLTTNYIKHANVEEVNLETEKLVDALVDGHVDAASTWSPFTVRLRKTLGKNAVVLAQPGIYIMTWNVVTTSQYTKDNPEDITKFLRAISKANDFIRNHPVKARAIAEKSVGTDSGLFRKEWNNYDFITELDESLILNLQDQAKWIIREEENGQDVLDFTDHVYTKSLAEISPGSVRIIGE